MLTKAYTGMRLGEMFGLRRVDAGQLQPGARLPAERDLAEEYGIAYGTARRVVQELRDRG
ncbi:GntR family transcriptional regulator, partial [Streptomyces sp. A73]|nr:GntR family transcriptional regulator [Streptomyces sp. A73]